MAKYRNIQFDISRTHLYGHYKISAQYKGTEVNVITTDAECFDWLNDDSNKEKHLQAKRHAYFLIRNTYES